jgi:hypothetical protein
MASTNAKHGSLPKSIWTKVERWFSNTSDPPGEKTTDAKKKLGKAVWRATFAVNEFDRQNQKRPLQ